jgi:hypothetical protein
LCVGFILKLKRSPLVVLPWRIHYSAASAGRPAQSTGTPASASAVTTGHHEPSHRKALFLALPATTTAALECLLRNPRCVFPGQVASRNRALTPDRVDPVGTRISLGNRAGGRPCPLVAPSSLLELDDRSHRRLGGAMVMGYRPTKGNRK